MVTVPDNRIEELGELRLPALTANKQRLWDIIDHPATSYADLGVVIGRDPGLCVRLFQELGRSPRPPKEPVLAPSRITGLLGMAAVRNLAQSTPSLEDRFRGPALQGLQLGYSRALHAAALARGLAGLHPRGQPEDEATTALLHGLGALVLWARAPGTMVRINREVDSPDDLDLAALRHLGASLSDLGEQLSLRWGMPERIARVQHLYNSLDPTLQLPLLAATLAWWALRNWHARETQTLVELAAELLQAPPDRVRARVLQDLADAARTAHALGLPQAGPRLMLTTEQAAATTPPQPPVARLQAVPPPPTPRTPRDAPEAPSPPPGPGPIAPPRRPAAPPRSPVAAPAPTLANPVAPPDPVPAVKPPVARTAPQANAAQGAPTLAPIRPKPAPATRTARAPARPAAPPQSPAAQAAGAMQGNLTRIFQTMRSDLGMTRVLFAMLSPDRAQIRARLVLEDRNSGLDTFSVPTGNRNLFAMLVAKPHALWVNPDNKLKFLPLVPTEAAHLINTREFFLASVVTKSRPIGMVYADAGGTPLDQAGFDRFKALCHRVAVLFSAG